MIDVRFTTSKETAMPRKTTGKGYTRLMGRKKSQPRKPTPKPDDAAIAAAVAVTLKTKKDRDQKPKNPS
jgi:hypothetical protein